MNIQKNIFRLNDHTQYDMVYFFIFYKWNSINPVTTACFSVTTKEEVESEEWKGFEVNEIKDKEFLKFISEKNMKFGFINIYCGETSQLSSWKQ